MRHTANETQHQTLTRLIRALDRRHPVTITYVKADGTETVRTIEIHDVQVTQAGDIVLKAADRGSRELQSWRLDRIRAYTIHRTGYLVPLPARDDFHRPAAGLATVTVLYPVDCPAITRVQLLADALAA